MIKYLEVSNFYSIKDESVLIFDSGKHAFDQSKVNSVVGFAGPNASGKTNVLKTFTFLFWFMQNSFSILKPDEDIPFEQFINSGKKPTHFKLEFSLKDKNSQWINYNYELILTNKKVLFERLDYAPHGRIKNVFIREEDNVNIGYSIPKIKVADLRSNCSFISYGSKFKRQEVLYQVFDFIYHSNVTMSGMANKDVNLKELFDIIDDKALYEDVLELLKIADLGLVDIIKKEEKDIEQFKQEIQKFIDNKDEFELDDKFTKKLKKMLKDLDSSESIERIVFLHRIEKKAVEFEYSQESDGTQQFLKLIYQVLHALREGNIMIWDEIESRVHQDLIIHLIKLFQNPERNPKGAQLIFSFHNSIFMDYLHPEQLWFTEKNDYGHTEIFSASSFKDIKNLSKKSLDNLYRIGRFGAIPRNL